MTRLLPLFTLLVAATAFGANSPASRLSVFFVDPSEGDHGYGVAVDYSWSAHFSTSFAISSEPTSVTRLVQSSLGQMPVSEFEEVYPVDLLLRYHHVNASRFRPYAGIGGRFIRSGSTENYRPELNAGVRFALSHRLALEADWKRLYNQRSSTEHIRDGQFGEGGTQRMSLGLTWGF